MTEECQARWEATREQIETIIIHATKNIGHQYLLLLGKASIPHAFMAIIIRNVEDEFEKSVPKVENSCDCA